MSTLSSNTTTVTVQVVYLSNEVKGYIELFGYIIIGIPLALLGSVSNIINATIFIKLGVRDPMNISLLGLSISDLCSSFFVIWNHIHYAPGFSDLGLPFRGMDYLFGIWPRFIFVSLTCCITTFISVERCLCVTFPLKIKDLITTKKVAIVTIGIYAVILGISIPVFVFNRIVPMFNPSTNMTIYTVIPYNRDKGARGAHYVFMSFGLGTVLTFFCFVVIILSTLVLIRHLKKSSEWRNKATTQKLTTSPSLPSDTATTSTTTNTSNSNTPTTDQASSSAANRSVKQHNTTSMSTRDSRVVKMVVVISVLFIACFTPIIISTISFVVIPGLKLGGKYQDFHPVMYSIVSTMESTNASLNILIYYRMSSNYRAMFDRLFGCRNIKNAT